MKSLYFDHGISAQSLYILSLMFQHFTHNISLVIFCILCHSTLKIFEHSKFFISVTQSCSLWNSTCNQDIQKRMIKQSRTIPCQLKISIPFTKTCTGDMYVTTSFCLTICTIHFANGSEQCIDCTYSGTNLLNSYQVLKSPVMANYVCKLPKCDMRYWWVGSLKQIQLDCQ